MPIVSYSIISFVILCSLIQSSFGFQYHTSSFFHHQQTKTSTSSLIKKRQYLKPLQLYFTTSNKPKTIKVNYMNEYIESHELANDLRLKPLASTIETATIPQEQETAVIDVRSHMEYAEGHIRGARHLPSDHFMNENFVRNIIEEYKNTKRIIFHCALSKQRGPTCARIFYSQLMKLKQEKLSIGEEINESYNPKVLILNGGFEEFGSRYGNDETLIEIDEMFR